MEARDFYGYSNKKFVAIRDPMKAAVGAYQEAARRFDGAQEWLYIEAGLPHTARVIHDLAHLQPKHFDELGDAIHENHLMVEYPATTAAPTEFGSVADVFRFVMDTYEEIQSKLWDLFKVVDNAEFKPIALKVEEMMAISSAEQTRVLEMWFMYDEANDPASFDVWVEEGEK